MAVVKTESRNRIGVTWFDNEDEADEYALQLVTLYPQDAIAQANIGFAQCGRDRAFDLKDEEGNRTAFAVVTP
jgi:hypothetical protein